MTYIPGGGGTTFIGLTDVPSTFVGQANKVPTVNVGETALEFVTPAGGGDMVLASTQTVSGLKTFLDSMFGLRNVANTFTSFFRNSNTANRTYTLKDADGTLAFTTDITGTNSGTNTGDQTISDATITTTDITTNNFTTAKHGFVPKGTNVGSFLKDDGTWGTPIATASDQDISPTSSRTIATGKTVVIGKTYKITGSLNLTIQGDSILTII